jgi:uncharacterized protein YecE (DUF72 family)
MVSTPQDAFDVHAVTAFVVRMDAPTPTPERSRRPTAAPFPGVAVYLGLVGFVYPEWAGLFYPPNLSDRDRLAFYATRFNAVEINTTFYGAPAPSLIKRWKEIAPQGFRFCLKAPRDVTHGPTPEGSLANAEGPAPGHFQRPETLAAMARLLESIAPLGDRLGNVLMQFPPAFEASHRAELADFLDRLAPLLVHLNTAAPHARLTVEFRHQSWWTPETAALLTERAIGWAATDESPQRQAAQAPSSTAVPPVPAPRPIQPTADTLYLRWLGKHGQFRERTRERFDPTPRLRWWIDRVEAVLRERPAVRTIYAFFDNDFAGFAPATAARLAALLGHAPPAVHAGPTRQDAQAMLFDPSPWGTK